MDLSYKCVALDGVTETKDVKRDGDYYWLCLGALNIYNSKGQFYDLEASKAAFDKSTVFMRKMDGGNLYGEDNHPVWLPHMSEEEFLLRNEDIDTDRIAVHIREIEFVPTERKCNNLPVVEIWGWVKPDKMRGEYLKAALDNPHQNVCFSIRCWVREKWVGGIKHLAIDEAITFDWVIEPGVSVANKYYVEADYQVNQKRLARESFSVDLTTSLADRVLSKVQERASSGRGLATESYVGRHMEELVRKEKGITVKQSGLFAQGW